EKERKIVSFSARTFSELLNDMFFIKNLYMKVALKNHINLFLKFRIVNT
ncbi:Os12g0602200, partial [Oryza sativa Japonica Group]